MKTIKAERTIVLDDDDAILSESSTVELMVFDAEIWAGAERPQLPALYSMQLKGGHQAAESLLVWLEAKEVARMIFPGPRSREELLQI